MFRVGRMVQKKFLILGMDIKTSSRWKMGYKPRFFEKLNQQDELTLDNADDGLHE